MTKGASIDLVNGGMAMAKICIFSCILGCFFLTSSARADVAKYSCPDLPAKAVASDFSQPVYQGKDGWFFRQSDLTHQFALTDSNAEMLKRMNSALRLQGTKFFMLPVPTRGIMANKFAQDDGIFENKYIFEEAFAEQQFKDIIAMLESYHIGVVDILGYLEKHPDDDRSQYFFARDIHWSTTGAAWSAPAAALEIKNNITLNTEEIKNYQTKKNGLQKSVNSPTNLILNQICADRLPSEIIDTFETKDNSQSLDAFLDDNAQQNAPVHLIGTSFSVESFAFHFAGFLRSELQADVADYALTGGGIDQSLYDWSHSDARLKSPPKALLWEIPYIDRLPIFPEPSARQIVPALGGLCTGTANAIQEMAYDKQNKLIMNVTKRNISGSSFYLASNLSDDSMRVPTFKLSYDDGQQEDFSPRRPERVLKVNKLFWELSDIYPGNLKSVEIEFEPGKIETGTLALCKYPDSVIQQTTN